MGVGKTATCQALKQKCNNSVFVYARNPEGNSIELQSWRNKGTTR